MPKIFRFRFSIMIQQTEQSTSLVLRCKSLKCKSESFCSFGWANTDRTLLISVFILKQRPILMKWKLLRFRTALGWLLKTFQSQWTHDCSLVSSTALHKAVFIVSDCHAVRTYGRVMNSWWTYKKIHSGSFLNLQYIMYCTMPVQSRLTR